MLLSKLTAEIIRRNTKKYDDMRIAKQTPPAGVSVEVYDYLPDGDSMHRLNVYRPEEVSGKLPVIVNIHGGAWVYGDKDLNKYYCMYLASKVKSRCRTSLRPCASLRTMRRGWARMRRKSCSPVTVREGISRPLRRALCARPNLPPCTA